MTNKEIHTAIKVQARQQQRESRQQQKQAQAQIIQGSRVGR